MDSNTLGELIDLKIKNKANEIFICQIQEKIEKQDEILASILQGINDINSAKGIAGRISTIENQIQAIEDKQSKASWWKVPTFSAILSAVITALGIYFKS